jgi:hypothetical protein
LHVCRWVDGTIVVSDKGGITGFVLSTPMKKGTKMLGMDPVEMGVVEEGEIFIPCLVNFHGSDTIIQIIVKCGPEGC